MQPCKLYDTSTPDPQSTRALSHSTAHARELSYAGHCAILDAITTGDTQAAEAAMSAHLREVDELTQENLGRRRGTSGRRA